MPPLPPTLRNLLAKTIQQARRSGEAGARQALQSLAVDRAKPIESMTLRDRALRNRLRLRGRHAGDQWDRKTRTQSLDHLIHEVTYEHWHRMLFARFLAENGLLRHPEYGVDLSLEDCRELADDEGVDPWEYAARCAQQMLPQIFRQDDPVLELSLPPETRQEFERLLDELAEAVFTAPDSLGWTYQFWQAERKDEINRGGGKIGADELPAVTQLFTEHYMVLFLLHNTIGAWRAGRILADSPELAWAAPDEEELRRSVRLETEGGYDFSCLRFVRGVRVEDEGDERTGPWRPASGSFPDWPREAASLRVLDPCCGSGHFLVEAFELLVRLRMAEERLAVEEAIRAVLRDNLFGLEIDPRCTQIAAFNLALAAWRLAGDPIDLPPLNIACTGLAPNASEVEWRQLAESAEDSSGLAKDRDLFGGDASLARGPCRRGWSRCTSCSGELPSWVRFWTRSRWEAICSGPTTGLLPSCSMWRCAGRRGWLGVMSGPWRPRGWPGRLRFCRGGIHWLSPTCRSWQGRSTSASCAVSQRPTMAMPRETSRRSLSRGCLVGSAKGLHRQSSLRRVGCSRRRIATSGRGYLSGGHGIWWGRWVRARSKRLPGMS